MALRKDAFDHAHERTNSLENSRMVPHDSITLEISRDLYRRIKAAATRKHLTTSQYVEQLLDEMVPEISEVAQSGHPPTRENIERLRELREELFRKNNYQLMGNSVEELRELREERLTQLLGENNQNDQ